MLKIYGIDISAPTNLVRYVANYLELEHEFIVMMPHSDESNSEDYRLLNPSGKIPSLDDNGFKLFESVAIIRYLAEKSDSNLYPKSLQEKAQTNAWMDFVSNHIGGAVRRVFFNSIVAKLLGEEVDEKSLECGYTFLQRFLPLVEKQLSQKTFLNGTKLSLADFVLLANLDPLGILKYDFTPYPSLISWQEKLKTEKFYQIDRSFGEKMLQEMQK